MMDCGPIFIGGPDRCGKTTMQAFLVSHPNISIPAVGSNMWTYFYGQYGSLSRPENFERCLQAMVQYKHVAFLQPDPDRIRREFWQGPPTYERLFALVHEHHAERTGKPRWGVQTELIERYADLVFVAYPGAMMIHMIRDPRDRYEASLARSPDGKGRAGGATARWLYSVRLASRNQRKYPDRYKVVRYETMVMHPEVTIREVCAFLDEEYTPAMLTMENVPRFRKGYDEESHGTSGQQTPLSTAFIGRYRQAIPKREIAFMQRYARREMLAYDYALEPIQFTRGDRLAFAVVDWPLNLARMVAWRILEIMQHNFPALIGRKPAANQVLSRRRSGPSRTKTT